MDGDAWSALVRHARNSDPEAYADLYLRLESFRRWFTRRVFADPEAAYGEFVRELVDQIRYGFLRDPRSLLAQARARAMRKTADRIRCLTTAARVLSAIPKRDREIWIRSQLAFPPAGDFGPEAWREMDSPTRREPAESGMAGESGASARTGGTAVLRSMCAASCETAGGSPLASL
jgi:hypothetical protein